MYRRVALALLSLAAVLCPRAFAEDKPAGNRLTIHSKVLGEDRVAQVRTPDGYDHSGQRFPVLYMTDGNNQLGHTAGTIEFLARNGRMPEMIVVAINNTDRTRDLTPTSPKPSTSSAIPGPAPGQATGGADKFLQFIETELIPEVEKTYRTQPYRVFAGHSLGGLLAMHAFATKNELFNAYIAVSPSLWWDDQVTVRKTAEFLKGRKELDRKLFLTLGDEKGGMRPAFDKAKEILGQQQLKDFTWDSLLLEDEDHGTVVLRSHYAALKKIFDGWKPDPKILAGGAPAVEKHYAELSAKYKYTILPSENMMNQLGYQLFGSGKKDEGIAVLKSNVERYPNSANVYDSLAELYEKSGKLDLAVPNYERAVQLGEKNSDANLQIFRTNFERASKGLKGGRKTPTS